MFTMKMWAAKCLMRIITTIKYWCSYSIMWILISQYNATELPQSQDRMSMLMGTLLVKRIKIQGFHYF